ncbi:MAG: phage terminase large subunit family protein [Planctomycetaceae bacterium]|nr:phage terminase large subunit family protein [Planctomycetaceae bacterium]
MSKTGDPGDDSYERHKRDAAARQAALSAAGRAIPELPPVANPKRRSAAKQDLGKFLLTYFPKAFPLKWSKDHESIIAKVKQAVLSGGLFAMAMPRGSGKTTVCERAILWAVLYGHHRFAMLIGANKEKADESIDKIKTELETNELLLADFPEVCIPCRRLEGIANRAKGQTFRGVPTKIVWGKRAVVFATIPDAAGSGAIVKTGAIKSAVRGANYLRPDGEVERPTLVLLDDPQTRDSARSENQTNAREQIVAADVLGLAGPGKSVAALMTCTVIQPNDLADRMLNRATHPDWQGERKKLLYAMPKHMARWEEYRELVADLLARDATPEQVQKAANAFYRKHRKELEEGAIVAWPERKRPCDVTALQSAMNLYFLDPEAFASEYQNEPLVAATEIDPLPTADQVARKVNPLARGRVPLRAQRLTAMVDVHDRLLFWAVCWWDDDFTGGVLSYGTWPKQTKGQFTLRAADPTIKKATKLRNILPAIRKALDTLLPELASQAYKRDDAIELRPERILVDAGYGQAMDTVYAACRESPFSHLIRPAHGKGISEKHKPMSEWPAGEGERGGHHWFRKTGKRGIRYLVTDVNYWKSFVHEALSMDPAEDHSLSLFQSPPHIHRLFAQHLTAETRERKSSGVRSVDIWSLPTAKPDNHWFDCVVGCAVGASELGCKIENRSRLIQAQEPAAPLAVEPPSVSYLEL